MNPLHPWKVTVQEAIRIQEELKDRVIVQRSLISVKTIGGADVAYSEDRNLLFGAIVVLSFPNMELLDTATAIGKTSFPYIPGLFSFREGPILIKAFQKLRQKPGVMIYDGQGIAHPRGLGLASHLGLWLDLPSVGCAKTPLLGEWDTPGPFRGSFQWIRSNQKAIGAVVRTRDGVKPLFISPGHKIDLMTSINLVLESCRGFRIPEPLRRAHQLAQGIERSRNASRERLNHLNPR